MDIDTIHALAGRLRERADEIRDLADDLGARADAVAWSGLAADAMRAHAADRLAALRRTAVLHDVAADAIDQHARAVDGATALGDAVLDTVHGLVDDVRGLLP